MKFSKPIFLNWHTLLGLTVFALIGVVCLILIWNYKSDNRKDVNEDRMLSHTEPSLDPQPHPHPRYEESPSQPGNEVEAHTSVENATEAEKTTKGKSTPRVPKEKDILSFFQPALKLQFTDPIRANELLHIIAKELGDGDMELTEYFHLKGHTLFNRFADVDGFYLSVEEAVRYYELKEKLLGLDGKEKKILTEVRAEIQWNVDGKVVFQQTQPIRDVLAWMQENAPVEWEIVNKSYIELLKEQSVPELPIIDNWKTITDRVDLRYDIFFEKLEGLSKESLTFKTLFDSSWDKAQESLLSERKEIQAQSSRPQPIAPKPEHTWDTVHEPPPNKSEK